MRIARSATALILAAWTILGVYARSQPAGPEVASAGNEHVEGRAAGRAPVGLRDLVLFAAGSPLMVGDGVMPLVRWYAEERGEGSPLACRARPRGSRPSRRAAEVDESDTGRGGASG